MIRTPFRMRLCLTLLLCNLAFIWGNSLLPGEISGAFSEWVKEILSHILPLGPDDGSGGHLLRKLAHFTEFTALGALLCWLTAMVGKKTLLALLSGAAAACVDETIQMFVPDRGPSLRDVGIDTCGVLLGIILLTAGNAYFKKKHTKPSLEDNT